MNVIIEACVIMHNMIVEIRMDEYVYDGAFTRIYNGGLRENDLGGKNGRDHK